MGVKGLIETSTRPMTGTATVIDACRVMNAENTGAVAIVKGRVLCGIFTYRDLVDRVILAKKDPETTTLDEVMTTKVEALTADTSFGDALRKMIDNDYTYVPIVAGKDALVGMLSLRGLLEHEIDHLASELDSVTQYIAVDGPGGD